MRLRQFVINSLTRVRSKKKKHKNTDEKALNNEHCDRNCNQLCSSPFLEIGREVPFVKNDCFSDTKSRGDNLQLDNRQNVDFTEALNININSTPNINCRCLGSTPDVCDTLNGKQCNLWQQCCLCELDEQGKCCGATKTRSRIKTNPWLPSPRIPHHIFPTVGMLSAASSTCSTPSLKSPREMLPVFRFDEESLLESSNDSLMDTERSYRSTTTDSDTTSGSTSMTDEATGGEPLRLWNFNSIVENQPLCPDSDMKSPICEVRNETINCFDDTLNFQYEDTLDSLLEQDAVQRDATYLSIADLLADEAGNCSADDMDTPEGSPMSDSGSSSNTEQIMSNSEDQNACHDDDIDVMSDCMVDSTDTGYSSLTRASHVDNDTGVYINASDGLAYRTCDEEPPRARMTIMCRPRLSINDSGLEPTAQSSRSIGEVRSSLEEKVYQLRQEKLIVKQKISEAQEEERIRKEEKQRLKKQLTVHRKQMLLKTLRDVKDKLENQSRRLQKSYNAVLSMQRKFSQRKPPLIISASLT